MTHCPCAFCEDCFKAYFTTAIKEKTIDKLVCPLCSLVGGAPGLRRQDAL